MTFDDTVKFYGTYRPYQQRVLDNLETFLDNEKIHVVAAPGSGKTILGLELIKRLDQPSLILNPSIAIREQWISRFVNNFLENKDDANKWISNNLYDKKPIISITYQALYFAYQKEKNVESDEFYNEEVDYSNFDLLSILKEYNIKTICLDECHHLKAEWWKIIENIVKQISDCKIIALTATPPYESSNQEWQRYIDLCGPIDEEIFVPELIKDKNLCPHQDYIYFSFPTENEEKEIMNIYAKALKIYNKYKNDNELLNVIIENKIYQDVNKFKKLYYENTKYYQALITFLLENNIVVPLKIKLMINKKKFDINDFEILLENVLFNDSQSYQQVNKLNSIKKELVALKLIYNHKVHLVNNERIDKKVTFSLSKLESIKNIINFEFKNLNADLRCLVLTDYVKSKYKKEIGNDFKDIDSFGSIPIFEYLRRNNLSNISIGCISGMITILPISCLDYLDNTFSYEILNDHNYVEVIVNYSQRKQIIELVTKMFEKGLFKVLIATKSLLGEGWDSPCINTLIMASFVGSYVLSNQMRGRAIRFYNQNVNKKANVWHLACLNPYDYHLSYDFYNLEKRFSSFVGINIQNHTIENGLERLGINNIPYSRFEVNELNQKTMAQAKDREQMSNVWNQCIQNAKDVSILTKVTTISKKRLNYDLSFFNSFFSFLLSFALLFVDYDLFLTFKNLHLSLVWNLIITIIIAIFCLTSFIINLIKIIFLSTPKRKLKFISKATLKALYKTNNFNSLNIKIVVKKLDKNNLNIYLENAKTYEQNVFSNCLCQIFAKVDEPRYLLAKPKLLFATEFYIVPDIFKKNRNMVKIFAKEMSKIMGGFAIIFAKNNDGKNIVLRAKKIYNLKYSNTIIKSKNILLEKNDNN